MTIAGKTEGGDNERVRVSVGEYRDRVNETERKIETARVLCTLHCTHLAPPPAIALDDPIVQRVGVYLKFKYIFIILSHYNC